MRMSPYSLCKCPRWRELNTAAEPRILTKTPHGYTQGNIMGNSRIAPLIYIRIHTSNIRINASNKRVVRGDIHAVYPLQKRDVFLIVIDF